MKNRFNFFLGVLFIIVLFFIFKVWFLPGVITGGDLWYFFPSMYENHVLYPQSWLFFVNNGFGGSSVLFSSINLIFAIPLFFGRVFNLSWEILVRIFFLIPYLLFSIIFNLILFKKVFIENKLYVITLIIFMFNTYVLMLISGGLIVIGMAYSFMPLIIYLLIRLIRFCTLKSKHRVLVLQSLFLGISFGIQMILDLRIMYITLFAVLIYLFTYLIIERKVKEKTVFVFYCFILPLIISCLINAFWLIPAFFIGNESFRSLGDAYTSVESLKFFSFAFLENSISILHPNWPENIFGKIGFMKFEFILLPVIAFSSLFFVNKDNKKNIIPLILIALLGIFLSKGTNPPFGEIYELMFKLLPGFVLFRDPTKWYLLVAFAYAYLIPFTIFEVSKKYNNYKYIVILTFIIYFLILIFPALIGNLNGTLKSSSVPNEYKAIEKILSSDKNFSRVLWVPHLNRFSYNSKTHPAVSADQLFNLYSSVDLGVKLNEYKLIENLRNKSIKYIIIPSDPLGEIYIKDRKYYRDDYLKTYTLVSGIKDLKQIVRINDLVVFEIKNYDYQNNLSINNKSSSQDLLTNIGVFVSIMSISILILLCIILKIK